MLLRAASALRLARLHAGAAPSWPHEFDLVSPAVRTQRDGARHAKAYAIDRRLGIDTNALLMRLGGTCVLL